MWIKKEINLVTKAALGLAAVMVSFSAASAHTRSQAAAINYLQSYPEVDPRGQVSKLALARALAYFDKNEHKFINKVYIAIVDFTRNSLDPRLHLVNLRTGAVESYGVAHGKGSDPSHSNMARRFSDRKGSNASSVGFYRTAETYFGKHGLSMRIDGLSATNSNARIRDIVIHSAWYVDKNSARGRSNGCFVVSNKVRDRIIMRLGRGALIYAYGGTGRNDQ